MPRGETPRHTIPDMKITNPEATIRDISLSGKARKPRGEKQETEQRPIIHDPNETLKPGLLTSKTVIDREETVAFDPYDRTPAEQAWFVHDDELAKTAEKWNAKRTERNKRQAQEDRAVQPAPQPKEKRMPRAELKKIRADIARMPEPTQAVDVPPPTTVQALEDQIYALQNDPHNIVTRFFSWPKRHREIQTLKQEIKRLTTETPTGTLLTLRTQDKKKRA